MEGVSFAALATQTFRRPHPFVITAKTGFRLYPSVKKSSQTIPPTLSSFIPCFCKKIKTLEFMDFPPRGVTETWRIRGDFPEESRSPVSRNRTRRSAPEGQRTIAGGGAKRNPRKGFLKRPRGAQGSSVKDVIDRFSHPSSGFP
jgi:hypothetical protein